MKIIVIFLLGLVLLTFSNSTRIEDKLKDKSIFSFNKIFQNNFLRRNGIKFNNFKFKTVTSETTTDRVNVESTAIAGDQYAVLYQGWMKYMEINEDAIDVPSCFNKNKVFFLQQSENSGINTLARDNIGYVNIPNEDFFFFELTPIKLNLFSGRNLPYKKFERALILADLIPQVALSPCKGGVEDVGNFAEGYCFMLKFVNFSRHFIWELCAETVFEKDKWMNKIIALITKKEPLLIEMSPIIPVGPAVALPAPGVVGLAVGPHVPFPHPHVVASLPRVINHGPALFDPHVAPAVIVPTVGALPPPVLPGPVVPGPGYPYPGPGYPYPAPGYPYPGPVAPGFPGPVVPAAVPVPVAAIPTGYSVVGPWTPCSRPCGEGIQTRPLDCMDENLCIGLKFQQRLCNIEACKEDVESHLDKLKKVSDGQWEFLGTWTTCSKLCGGGIQTIERRCVGGVCVGDTVLTHECNTFVCGQDPKNMVISATEIFNRSMFDECKLLEGNLMLVFNQEKILAHVEVNLQTIQIFPKNNPTVPIVFPLNKLGEVRPSVSAPGCFKLVGEAGNVVALCPQSPQATPCDVWIRRIIDFKYNCSNKVLNKIQSDISTSLEIAKDPEANANKLNQMQKKVLDDEKMRSGIKEKALESQFEEFKRQTKDLLAKEDAYETKLEQQEKDRIDWEDKKMKESSLKEQKAAQKLLQDLKALADADSAYAAKERTIKREMKGLMNDVQTKITSKREKLITKLQRMRTLHEIGEKKTAKELMDMKREMGKKLSNMAKKGSPSQCYTKNIAMMNNYCTANIPDLEMQVECKKPNQYCYICCDNEIGPLNKDFLNCCYNKCDEIENSMCIPFNETYHITNQNVAFLG